MKRIIALSLCLLMAAASFAYADGEPFANAGEVFQSWYQNTDSTMPYPEYVTGVWSTDGSGENLTFAIIEGHEDQAKAEILDRVSDKDSVTFTEGGKYTMSQLKEVQDYISAKMSEGAGTYPIWGCGIYDRENAVICEINTSNDKAQAVMDELKEKYGDMVAFNESSAAAAVDTAAEESGFSQELPLEKTPVANIIAYVLIGIGIAALIASAVILKKKRGCK